METILVTGGAGFIGSHLCMKLLSLGYKVVLLDRFTDSDHKSLKNRNIEMLKESPKLEIIDIDITDIEKLAEIFQSYKIDIIFHFAIDGNVKHYFRDPVNSVSDNIRTSSSLFAACKNNKVQHILFASSALVYGLSKDVPFKENDPCLSPTSPYAVTMRSNELLAHSYHRLYNTPFTGLRFFPIIGPNMREDLFLPTLISSVIKNKKIIIYGDGLTIRSYIWVDDIIWAMIKLITKPDGYQLINLGSDNGVSHLEMVQITEKILGKKIKLKFLAKRPEEITNLIPSIETAKSTIGFLPTLSTEEVVKRYVDWYKKNH